MVGQQDRFAATFGEVATAGFTLYDIRGYYRIGQATLLTLGVENFTDKRYLEHLDLRTIGLGPTFQPGASFYTGVERTY